MERIISPEERIRRAEEIYYKRKAQGVRVTTTSVNIGKQNKISLGKKMTIQIIVCLIIYLGFWLIKGYNSVFSENVINNTKAILSYDINIGNLYHKCVEYFNNDFNNIIKIKNLENEKKENQIKEEKSEEVNQENNQENNQAENQNSESNADTDVSQDVNKQEENQSSENTQDEGIGGGSDIQTNSEHDGTQKAKMDYENKTQMELDAEYIKQNFSIIKPIEGKITSNFGAREETDIISAFHQGVDIGATTGTPIHAAIEGTVIASSYAGDYGNHIKIQNGEIITVYAHCSQLNVKVGEYVKQGQEIGKVGATGKVTGAHLHFEFRRDGRYVDPEMILSF